MLTSVQGDLEASFQIYTHGPGSSPSSSDLTGKHQRYDRRPPKNVRIQGYARPRHAEGGRKPPHSPVPRTSYQSKDEGMLRVFPRDAEDLYKEAFYEFAPATATDYPCTQNELNASGGANRRTAQDARYLKHKTKWFAHPNKGPFLDARIAAREVYDHNNPKRTPSAAENEAIKRLIAEFENAGQKPWGPDLAIKAFCDLDKVFFCGRLKGHVCLTWKPDGTFAEPSYGETAYLGDGKCVIKLNAYTILVCPKDESSFVQMFSTLLHEMW